jgi:hypothetical protein
MPNDRIYYVDGFIVYREYAFQNPITFDLELSREEHDCYTEEQAKKAVEELKLEYPGDKVYYEAGRILD